MTVSERQTIDRDQVLHVASLARLKLEGEEVERLTAQLNTILGHIAQLQEVDTSTVAPHEYATAAMPLRPDEARPGLEHDEALAPSPKVLGDGFCVPAFVDS